MFSFLVQLLVQLLVFLNWTQLRLQNLFKKHLDRQRYNMGVIAYQLAPYKTYEDVEIR